MPAYERNTTPHDTTPSSAWPGLRMGTNQQTSTIPYASYAVSLPLFTSNKPKVNPSRVPTEPEIRQKKTCESMFASQLPFRLPYSVSQTADTNHCNKKKKIKEIPSTTNQRQARATLRGGRGVIPAFGLGLRLRLFPVRGPPRGPCSPRCGPSCAP